MSHRSKKRVRKDPRSVERAVTMLPVNHNIVELRKAKGLTQASLAEKLGIHKTAVSRWERGFSTPAITHLPDVAAALGVTVDELLAEAA